MAFCGRLRLTESGYRKKGLGHRATERPLITNYLLFPTKTNFKKITNCSVVVNTSFNVRGEPIVCSVEDAYRCFMGTDLDMLICGNFVLYKNNQKTQSTKQIKISN